MLQKLALYLDYEGSKNIQVLKVLILGIGDLTQTQNLASKPFIPKFHITSVQKSSDHIQIKIKMPNPN